MSGGWSTVVHGSAVLIVFSHVDSEVVSTDFGMLAGLSSGFGSREMGEGRGEGTKEKLTVGIGAVTSEAPNGP